MRPVINGIRGGQQRHPRAIGHKGGGGRRPHELRRLPPPTEQPFARQQMGRRPRRPPPGPSPRRAHDKHPTCDRPSFRSSLGEETATSRGRVQTRPRQRQTLTPSPSPRVGHRPRHGRDRHLPPPTPMRAGPQMPVPCGIGQPPPLSQCACRHRRRRRPPCISTICSRCYVGVRRHSTADGGVQSDSEGRRSRATRYYRQRQSFRCCGKPPPADTALPSTLPISGGAVNGAAAVVAVATAVGAIACHPPNRQQPCNAPADRPREREPHELGQLRLWLPLLLQQQLVLRLTRLPL